MIPSNFQKIIAALYKKTKNQTVDWEEGSSADEFIVSFSTVSITLSTDVMDGYGNYVEEFYLFTLRDQRGKVIDDFSVSKNEYGYIEVNEMFHLARRIALHIDKAISEIEKGLDVKSLGDLPELSEGRTEMEVPDKATTDSKDDDLPF